MKNKRIVKTRQSCSVPMPLWLQLCHEATQCKAAKGNTVTPSRMMVEILRGYFSRN
jgi:hypothetical protein